jgi:tetratricopeptide (TPR) repeat protein
VTGRNEPCPCGSGRKYKKCCGQIADSALAAPLLPAAQPSRAPEAQHAPRQAQAPTPLDMREVAALISAGRHLELERKARELTARCPASGLAWKVLGVALKLQGKDPLAALSRAIALLPDDAEAHSNLGIALADSGRMDEAMASYRRALALKADYAEVHNHLGNALLDRGRPEEALASYRRALTVKPDFVDAHNNLGNALLQLGQFEQAASSYRRALELRPQYAEVHNNLGNALLDLDRLEQAAASYRFALQLKPDFAEAHSNLGNCLLQLGRFEDAAESYRHALQLAPESAKVHNNLGNALLHLGCLEEAAAACRRALALKADFAEAHSTLGNALMDLGRLEEAAASYEAALRIRPDFAEVHNNLGNVVRGLGRLDAAVTHYGRALQLKPDYAEAHNNLGVALRLQGRTAEAQASCARALAINPNSAATLATLAEARADLGQFAEAEDLFRRAIALQPDFAEAWVGIARLRTMTARDAPWLAEVQRLAQLPLRPREAISLHYAIGKYFDDLQEFDQAFLHYQRANELTRTHAGRHDRQRLAQAVDQLIHSYGRSGLPQVSAQGTDSERPVFIVGMPRSGTTLTEQILASHPQVFGAGELLFWSGASASCESSARGELSGSILSRLSAEYLNLLRELSPCALRVVDKMPSNFMFLGLIHAALPNARIIHMQRDPIDTCLSIYFQDFGAVLAYANDLEDLAHYYREYRRLMRHWRSILPENTMLDVPYEGLVDEQQGWSRKMLEFIGLPWDPRCLDFHQAGRSVVTVSKWQVRQKMSRSSVARWRNYQQHVGPLRLLSQLQ